MRDRDSFLQRLEARLGRVSRWLAERPDDARSAEVQARAEALRSEIARVRRSAGEAARGDLARAREEVHDMAQELGGGPPPHAALRRTEVEALRRLLATTARLLAPLSKADDPEWARADDEYERSWLEVERAFEAEEGPASHP
jgi:hypothetical protein